MDPNRRNRLRDSSAVSDRFLGSFAIDIPSSSSASIDGDLNEDDIFATDLSHTPRSSPSSSSPAFPAVRPIQRSRSGLGEASGILAALPEPSGTNHLGHVFHHRSAAALSTSVSSTASSSSSPGGTSAASFSSARAIPTAPKPPHERSPLRSSSSLSHPQSAPVKVPVISPAMMARRRKEFDLAEVVDEEEEEEEEEEGEMLPPHEIVARSLAQSSLLSCSVLEGAGRTLKGRDLRQVRNAVYRRTGFID